MDGETRQVCLGGFPIDHNLLHSSGRRASPAPIQHRFDVLLPTLEDCLDVPLVGVPDPPTYSQLEGARTGGVAEIHSLDTASYSHMDAADVLGGGVRPAGPRHRLGEAREGGGLLKECDRRTREDTE